MHGRRRRLAGLLLLALVLVGLLLIAGPHGALHHHATSSCALCCVQATEAPEPPRLVGPPLRVSDVADLPRTAPVEERAWTASAPRAPPEEL